MNWYQMHNILKQLQIKSITALMTLLSMFKEDSILYGIFVKGQLDYGLLGYLYVELLPCDSESEG